MRKIHCIIGVVSVLLIGSFFGCSRSRLCSMSDPDFDGRFNNNCVLGVATYGDTDKAKQKELELDRKIKERNNPTSRPSGVTTQSQK